MAFRRAIGAVVCAVLVPYPTSAAKLRPETREAWKAYVAATEERIESELSGSDEGFLVLDFLPARDRTQCERELSAGDVCIVELDTLDAEGQAISVPSGMIHHWYGAIFVPGASVDDVLEWEQAYEEHEGFFEDVEDSRLLSRDRDVFEIFLRLKRTKVLTVHYNTEHRVTYRRHGDGKASSQSVATSIRELQDPGGADEREKEFGDDRGFLWGLNSYWRFQERDGGTLVECESVSLSRDVPAAARWLVKNFLNSVPRESLEATLLPIRANLP